jgi:hypothetical protein
MAKETNKAPIVGPEVAGPIDPKRTQEGQVTQTIQFVPVAYVAQVDKVVSAILWGAIIQGLLASGRVQPNIDPTQRKRLQEYHAMALSLVNGDSE